MANLKTAQAIARIFKPSWPIPVKYFGGGSYGRVYETNDGRLMKFVLGNAPHEFTSLHKLQGSYVVPRFQKGNGIVRVLPVSIANKIHKTMFPNTMASDALTVFVMGRVGNSKAMTLTKYLQMYRTNNNKKANVQRRVEYLIEQMALRGVSHGDLHTDNIIVTKSTTGRITGMWVIDFGQSRNLSPGKTERQTMNRLKTTNIFPTRHVFPPYSQRNIPVREKSRANVHMMNVVYGKRLSPSWERRIANLRKHVLEEMKEYKSPVKGSRTLRAKSLSPKQKSASVRGRRSQSAPRTTP